MFDNKTILFYGPGVKKEEPDVNAYDFVIITNNQVSFFFDKFDVKTKVLLWVNGYFSRHCFDKIIPQANLIYGCISTKAVCARFKKIGIVHGFTPKRVSEIKKTPLGLIRVLSCLRDYDFARLDVVGVDFFLGERLYENDDYPPPGTLHETMEAEVLSVEVGHGIAENKAWFERFIRERKNVRWL